MPEHRLVRQALLYCVKHTHVTLFADFLNDFFVIAFTPVDHINRILFIYDVILFHVYQD